MPYEKTVETEQTVNTLNRKDDGYENLEISKYGSKYVEEKSAIKTFKPKLSKEAQTQEGTSKKFPDQFNKKKQQNM
uniref:Uncharacterized protein n=1 Tax=Panagrolaimus superbus TaxID=310955 RepID=A0A914XVT4_9BILA